MRQGHLETNNKAVAFCMESTRAEFEGRPEDASALSLQAWEAARDDYEACVAAHYVARFQQNPREALRWNLEALARADAAGDSRVESFYPSLYVNLGHAYEMLGKQVEARRYYRLAADRGLVHQAGEGARRDAREH
jgi:Flp pilus assembly protein TadD